MTEGERWKNGVENIFIGYCCRFSLGVDGGQGRVRIRGADGSWGTGSIIREKCLTVEPGSGAKTCLLAKFASRFLLHRTFDSLPPLASAHISPTTSQCHLLTDWTLHVQRLSIRLVVRWIWLDISCSPSFRWFNVIRPPIYERSAPTAHRSPPPLLSSQQTDSRPPTITYPDVVVENP